MDEDRNLMFLFNFVTENLSLDVERENLMRWTVYEIVKNEHYLLAIGTLIINLIVCLAGMLFAVIRWKRHRGISVLTIIILLLNAGISIILTFSRIYFIESKRQQVLASDEEYKFIELSLAYSKIYNLLLYAHDLLNAMGLVLLVVAVFLWRGNDTPSLNSVQNTKGYSAGKV